MTLPAQRHNFDLWSAGFASGTSRHDFYVSVGAGSQTAVLVHSCPTVNYEPNDDGLGDDAPSRVQKIGQEYGQQPNDVQNSKWASALKGACSDCGVEYSEELQGQSNIELAGPETTGMSFGDLRAMLAAWLTGGP